MPAHTAIPQSMTEPEIQQMAHAIRFLALDTILQAGEGHQGVPLGMAEIAATLYANHLTYDPDDPLWPDRDRVVLSNGHGSTLLYALLHLSGVKAVSLEALQSFRRLGGVCAGHPEIEPHAGIELTTGMLGQGIACAVGMALAEARLQADFGADLVDHRTWAFVGDGCLQEGVGQEAISLAGHLRLGKLTFLWDDNRITDDGDTALSISEDMPARFEAAGWHVVCVDGHDIAAIDAALIAAKADPRPSLIACRTVIARGLPRLQGQRGGHSAPLVAEDRTEAQATLGWTHGPFVVPEGVRQAWRIAMGRGRAAHGDWQARQGGHPQAARLARWTEGRLPDDFAGWITRIGRALPQTPERPTILSSGDICEALREVLPEIQVLCADLEAPTNHKRGRSALTASERGGSYVHCGVREHLMGAMVDGICAHGGLRPVNVTYLAFADYERPAMRMAAQMRLPGIFVFSHDGIGVGSNGPTHQPVEVLSSFRGMPNMRVFRPADAIETLEAWQIALETRDGPSLLALSKQPARAVRELGENLSRRGAYVLHEAEGARDVTLLATGTEVALAVQARETLAQAGLKAAVVSMPCWELFLGQSEAYRAEVLGQVPRLGIEAATVFGWHRWLRPEDGFVGMTGYGASDRAEVLYAHFGITAEHVHALAVQLVAVR